MLSITIEDWNEHLMINDVLECLADIPRDVGCFLIPSRVGMNISMMAWIRVPR